HTYCFSLYIIKLLSYNGSTICILYNTFIICRRNVLLVLMHLICTIHSACHDLFFGHFLFYFIVLVLLLSSLLYFRFLFSFSPVVYITCVLSVNHLFSIYTALGSFVLCQIVLFVCLVSLFLAFMFDGWFFYFLSPPAF
ncbi:hypothetical protein LDENG_00244250, partial [Lucifuga dentata]